MTKLRILVVRNDKLGDFMLAWPALALLKRSAPESEISVLVPKYTRELAQSCPWTDKVLTDPDGLHRLSRKNFDAVLTLFSTGRIGWQVFKGRIPLRVAPATKLAQIFYNHKMVQRRSRSEKPEYIYNLELAEALLEKLNIKPAESQAPFWPISKAEKAEQRSQLAESLKLDSRKPWFFLHCGSGGSANNLSLEQYADLINNLKQELIHQNLPTPCWVLTAGPGEERKAQTLHKMVSQNVDSVIYASDRGLTAFARSISTAQMMIAGSTGPLHIAGTLDVLTVGFFPAKRSATPLRWRPCNSQNNTLGFCPQSVQNNGSGSKDTDQLEDMSQIDTEYCAKKISEWLKDKEESISNEII